MGFAREKLHDHDPIVHCHFGGNHRIFCDLVPYVPPQGLAFLFGGLAIPSVFFPYHGHLHF